MKDPWEHYIEISPSAKSDGTRNWYEAAHASADVESSTLADGEGATIELALCDLIDALAGLAEDRY